MPRPSPPPVDGAVDRCLPVLDCGDCVGACTAGSQVRPFIGQVTIRRMCIGGACTDVFDPHRPCKDACAPQTAIDTTCYFDAQHHCVSGLAR
jgi:hypothetical protein